MHICESRNLTDNAERKVWLMLTPMVAAAEAVIDVSLVTELINLVKSVCGLFTIFPLNVFLIASLVFVGFKIFRSAKGAAK